MSDKPKVPRKAATVLLVRDGAERPEVFMVKRPARGDFPDLHVFPGGKVDEQDRRLNAACRGLDDSDASQRLQLESGGLGYWIAVIRECFEEAGVLLGYRGSEWFSPVDDAEDDRFEAYRNELISGDRDFSELMANEGIELATDRVVYFSHWITPEMAPARFDTRFFVAAMPPEQSAVSHAHETVSGTWVPPEEALANYDTGDWQMIFPTIMSLRMSSGYGSVADMLEAVRAGHHEIEVTAEIHRQGMQYS